MKQNFMLSGIVQYPKLWKSMNADVGGISPGSMPPHSTTLIEEGAIITSFKLVRDGIFQVCIRVSSVAPQMYKACFSDSPSACFSACLDFLQ